MGENNNNPSENCTEATRGTNALLCRVIMHFSPNALFLPTFSVAVRNSVANERRQWCKKLNNIFMLTSVENIYVHLVRSWVCQTPLSLWGAGRDGEKGVVPLALYKSYN